MLEEIAELTRGAMKSLLDRQREDYPFIDTKFHPLTGEDFSANDPLRGSRAVYSWIQGRGLEALAGHEPWLADERERIRDVLLRVVGRMEGLRQRNGGHLPFLMTPEGQPLKVDETGAVIPGDAPSGAGFADLFYAKGLAAAAACLEDTQKLRAAEQLFASVIAALEDGTFHSGQIALDAKNPVSDVAGRISQGPWMIAVGGATVFLRCTGEAHYARLGRNLIDLVLERHAQTAEGRFQPGDFWEFIDTTGNPWENGGRVWCDPGHATEFVGLALAHLGACHQEKDNPLSQVLLTVLVRNFQNGFSGGGIFKAFDLVSRSPINTDQPWWSLPETMRAAALALVSAPANTRMMLDDILVSCWTAFRRNYLRGHFHAVQCIDEQGEIVASIPATPDLDPCYHTGLSLLAVLDGFHRAELSLETKL